MSLGMIRNVYPGVTAYQDQMATGDRSDDKDALQSKVSSAEETKKEPSKEATETYSAPADYFYDKSPAERTRVNDAIRDMKRDHVLQRYQYFVSSANKIVNHSEDGVVIRK